MKYSLEQEKVRNHNAGFKAVDDVTKILHEIGYLPIVYAVKSPNRIYRNFMTIYKMLKLIFIIKNDDICFLQWPLLSSSNKILYHVLHYRCKHLQFLIHDLSFLRYKKDFLIERKFMEMSELVIAHTPAMKDAIISMGIDGNKIKVLTCFDYLVEDKKFPQRQLTNEVVYAGNFEKSTFLNKIPDYTILNKISFFCYGKKLNDLPSPLVYKGFFEPEFVSEIKGSWGLVWDGDSIETCNGKFGEYLRINSPHKFSLFIVARLPLIVWEYSALAYYVKGKELGITIQSLTDLPYKIESIDVEKYELFLRNIDKERGMLTCGSHIKNILL